MSNRSVPPGLRDLVGRFQRLVHAPPLLDRSRAEDALERHFSGTEIAGFPVRWARDAVEAYEEAARAEGTSAWHFDRSNVRHVARHAPYWTSTESAVFPNDPNPIPRAARRAAWTPPEIRVLQLASRDAWFVPLFADELPALPDSPRCAGLGAAMLAVRGAPQEVWSPFLDAIDAGLWVYWVLDQELLAVPRPSIRTLDGWLHAGDGPAASWPEGARYWSWRGVEVPRDLIERPELLTPDRILHEENMEVRRAMLDLFGAGRFLEASGAQVAHADDFGTLYRFEFQDGEPLLMVKVVNSTPEPDGSRKDYLLRVPPGMAEAREAVAWTFGLAGGEYVPALET